MILFHWLIICSVDRLVVWLVYLFIVWQIGRRFGLLAALLTGWLLGCWSGLLIVWSIGKLIDWLILSLVFGLVDRLDG